MGFLFNCSISHSAFHFFYKLGCMYVASRGNPVWDSALIAARVVLTHYLHSPSAALHPPKKSLWDPTMNPSFISGGGGGGWGECNRFTPCCSLLPLREAGKARNPTWQPLWRGPRPSALCHPSDISPAPAAASKPLFLLRRRLKRPPTNLI